MASLITGLFDTESAAENAVTELKRLGYSQDEISVIMRNRASAAELAEEAGTRTMSEVGAGAVVGGAVGAVLAGLVAVGSIVIPGGAVLVGGPLAAFLAGAGTGGIAGGLIGWLTGLGISHEVAPYYERGLSEGGVVVAVAAHPGDQVRVRQALEEAVAYSGHEGADYVAPDLRARFTDVDPPEKMVDVAGTGTTAGPVAGPAARQAAETTSSAAAVEAERRAEQRTADEHQREERRDLGRTNPAAGAKAAIENEADRISTAMKNEEYKLKSRPDRAD
jgi:hypothetical protein